MNFYTPVLNAKLSEKAVSENPTLKFQLRNAISVEFRRSGESYEHLSLVSNKNGSYTYNHLIGNDGEFIPDKANVSDIHILSMQEIFIGPTKSVEPFGTGTITSNFNLVDGATQYFFTAERCNFGFVSTITRNGNQITVDMVNASNAEHTLSSTILAIAYK